MTVMANPRSWCWRPGPVPACARTFPRCCTRWRGAACCRTPCTRSPRSPRNTSSSCSATTATASPLPSPSWPKTLGRTIDVAVQEQQLGTGHAVGCGLAALPADFAGTVVVTSGDVPLLDADTLAELIATHSAETAAATVLTTTLPDPTGYGRILRTQDREVIGIVEEGRRHPVAAGHQRGQRRCLRLRHRGAALGAGPAAPAQRPAGALPHRRHLDHPAGRPDRAGQARRRRRAGGRRQRPGPAGGAGRRTEPAHRGRPPARGCDDRRPRHHLDRRRRDHRPRHRHPARHAAAGRHPHRRPLRDRPGHHTDRRHRRRRGVGDPHPRHRLGHRRRRHRRPVHLPAARHRARRRRQARRVRRDEERHDRAPAPRCRT